MLKHIFAFFVFIVVSLAPACADEGYIPFFPDFLEPDGIGFKRANYENSNIKFTNINGKNNIINGEPEITFNGNDDDLYFDSGYNDEYTKRDI